jgi:hypothetical protein
MSWQSSLEGLSTFGGLVDGGCIAGPLKIESDYIVDVANKIYGSMIEKVVDK